MSLRDLVDIVDVNLWFLDIKNTAIEVIQYVKSRGIEVRFSSEDSFRSDLVDLLTIYSAVDRVGVTRVGIAGKQFSDFAKHPSTI